MRFGTAIERLVDNYRYAKSKVWIRDEVAWALYHTWKEADEHRAEQTEPNCSEKPNNCEDCIWSVCNYNKAFKDEPTISKMEQVDKPQTERSE